MRDLFTTQSSANPRQSTRRAKPIPSLLLVAMAILFLFIGTATPNRTLSLAPFRLRIVFLLAILAMGAASNCVGMMACSVIRHLFAMGAALQVRESPVSRVPRM